MNEIDLIENKELQDKLIEKIETLEKVKKLYLIPGTEYATTEQIAKFYDVELERIKKICVRHIDELKLDGMCIKNKTDFLKGQSQNLEILEETSYKVVFSDGQDSKITVTNRGIRIFTKRAILRIGMLLRGSDIAKEIRTQLLNLVENVEEDKPELLVKDINEEQRLILNQINAFNDGDLEGMMKASMELNQFKNKHIKKLEEKNTALVKDNKMLSNEAVEWDYQTTINRGIRSLAHIKGIKYGKMWDVLYSMLKYSEHMDLKLRKKKQNTKTVIETIKDDEWPKVMKQFTAICNKWGLSVNEVINKVGEVKV